jgi:hypothetical protein
MWLTLALSIILPAAANSTFFLKKKADRHKIRWDNDNSLAWELEQQHRAGDPRAEGVIWDRVGEVFYC